MAWEKSEVTHEAATRPNDPHTRLVSSWMIQRHSKGELCSFPLMSAAKPLLPRA